MAARRLGHTDLSIEPLILCCNVLGWTLEEQPAFEVLDAFVDAGFTAFDTSDSYGKGKSETILGRWMNARGNRDRVLFVGRDLHRPSGCALLGHRDPRPVLDASHLYPRRRADRQARALSIPPPPQLRSHDCRDVSPASRLRRRGTRYHHGRGLELCVGLQDPS